MMTNWSHHLDTARLRHSADVARAEQHRLVRRSRRARRRAAQSAAGTIPALPDPFES